MQAEGVDQLEIKFNLHLCSKGGQLIQKQQDHLLDSVKISNKAVQAKLRVIAVNYITQL